MTGLDGQLIGEGRDKNGYPMAYVLGPDGKRRNMWVHTAVARAFIGVRPEGMEVDHIDRDRANARPENLRYVTHLANVRNAIPARGERHGGAKLTETLVREILAIPPAPRYRGKRGNHPNSITAIAARYGVTFGTVHDIRTGRRWRHVWNEVRGTA